MNANKRDDEYISIDDPSYFRKDDDWWWVELGNIFNNIPSNDKFDAQRSSGCAMKYIKSLEAQNDNYWTMIEILRQRIKGNPLQDRFDAIAAGVVFGKAQEK